MNQAHKLLCGQFSREETQMQNFANSRFPAGLFMKKQRMPQLGYAKPTWLYGKQISE